MERLAVELHDSLLSAVRPLGDGVVLELSAYLHTSDGAPGEAPGKGWRQRAVLLIADGVVREPAPPGGERPIEEGSIDVGERTFDNLLPLPFAGCDESSVHLRGPGWNLVVDGSAVRLELEGERTFLEDFPG